MKKKLIHNLGLKILAVLFATCLWLISININDPISPRNYTLKVQLLNLSSMTSSGKYVEVLDDTDSIRVTVRASRSVFTNFSESNLVATADLNEITEDNKIPILISTTKTEDKIESIKSDKEYVSVNIENIKKTQIPIDVNVQNSPAAGYILGGTATDQNAVIISGPESAVSQISTASVDINVDGATSDVNISLPVRLYDETGEEVDDDRLTKSVNEIATKATIYQTKEVQLEFTTVGQPAQGYIFTGEVSVNPQSIIVAGKPGIMKNLTKITVPDVLNVAGADNNVQVSAEIKQYLPEGVILADSSFDGSADATAGIEKAQERTIEIYSSRIKAINSPEGYDATVHGLDTTMELVLTGLETQLAAVKADELNGYADIAAMMKEQEMETLDPGTYQVPVTFDLPDFVFLKDTLTVRVVVEQTE